MKQEKYLGAVQRVEEQPPGAVEMKAEEGGAWRHI